MVYLLNMGGSFHVAMLNNQMVFSPIAISQNTKNIWTYLASYYCGWCFLTPASPNGWLKLSTPYLKKNNKMG
jgi:hypothetical protein